MPDESRPSPGHTPEPAPKRPSAATHRHPALRARLGDIAEPELSAFSAHLENAESPSATNVQARQESGAAHKAPSRNAVRPTKRSETPGGSGGKMARRQRGSNGSGLKKFAGWVLLPCALAGGAGWAGTTERMAIAEVDVQGVEATPPSRVQPIWEALRGQNWLRVDLAAAQSRLAKLPTVQAASVSRSWSHWPPRLDARIQERSPWLRLGGGGSWWIVDRSGVAFRRATRQDRALYAITSTEFEAESLRVGQKVPPKIWDGVRRLALALDESSKASEPWQIRRAYLDRDNHASLRLRGGSQDGLLVRLGEGQWAGKMERAQRAIVFFQAAGRRAQSLNLVSFSMPTWTPLQPRPASPQAPSASPGTEAKSGPTRADDASNTASTTPTDISNTDGENATEAASSTSSEASTAEASRPGAAEDAAEDAAEGQDARGSRQRGDADGADGSA